MAEKTTDYPVLAGRIGANQLTVRPGRGLQDHQRRGDEGRNVGAPVTATGNHGTIRYTLTGTDAPITPNSMIDDEDWPDNNQ